MRYIRCFFIVLLSLLLFVNGKVEAFAMNTGFSTKELSKDDKSTFLSNVSISMLTDEPQKKAIDCFDVNQAGLIAIGSSSFERKTICIYDKNSFLYGFAFNSSGDIGIEWDGSNINIYFVRSGVIIAVNSMGEIVEILEVEDTTENNSYRNHFIYSTKRTVGDTEYTIRNDMGAFNVLASSYSQLIATSTNGQESIIYDVSSVHFLNMIAVFVGVSVLICFAVAVIIWQFIKLKRGT